MTSESEITPESTILIIDDSPKNLRVLSKTLIAHGYAVRCATSGAMAFVSIQNLPPDLILLDIRMPGMDGYEVCQRLKQNPATQDIPIIFLSALSDVYNIVKAFQIGGSDYITKPFQAEEVLARIQNQLTIQKLKQQLSTQNQYLLQEINERKKIEQALCQEIERRILIEASLQDAKNTAEAANRVKDEFLAQMNHELRTPLNIIIGFTTLMKNEVGHSQQDQEYLAAINESAQKMLSLISNILSVTHTVSSQLTLDEYEFDLHHLLSTVVLLWQPKALTKGLQLQFQQSPQVPQYIRADESKLRQILMNLFSHTIQLTQTGCITARADTQNQGADQLKKTCGLTIEISSTEVWPALDELSTLFQSFSHTEANQKSAQALGLNLLLVRQLAQVMGGDLFFRSAPGQGTWLTVHLSVEVAEAVTGVPIAIPFAGSVVQFPALEAPITPEVLSAVMPEEWLVQLHEAAVKGFDQQILSLLHQIPVTHASLTKTLETWAQNFQFDRIVELTQRLLP